METKRPVKPVITVSVTSTHTRTGKTAISALIADALADHGFSDIQVMNADGDFPKHAVHGPLMAVEDMHVEPSIRIDDTNGHGFGEYTPTFKVGAIPPKE